MKKIFLVLIASIALFSCKNEEQENQINALKGDKDSLSALVVAKEETLNEFISAFAEVEGNLTAIKEKEMNISTSAKSGEIQNGDVRDRINQDIQAINELMEKNKSKIYSLQSKLKKAGVKIADFEKLVEQLNAQLAQKDKELQELNTMLSMKNSEIEQLNSYNIELNNENVKKEKVIAEQTNKMNTVYYVVGKYKELKEKGIVSKDGGFMGIGKSKEVKQDFNADHFTVIDFTKTTKIPVGSKKAKVVSSHPTDSYKLDKGANGIFDDLVITNSEKFWRNSKYLVIIND